MIRAILKSGVIFPQSSLPGEWQEGEALIVEAQRDLPPAVENLEPLEPIADEELRTMLAAVEEHRRQQKSRMADEEK
ncbi:MAG: hypothetical protein SFU86_07830 [Pirellulaceae bacterium]|nr:hypothetical protein [Pirellulaceae bacterium]